MEALLARLAPGHPRAPQAGRGHPEVGEGLSTLGVPIPPLAGASTDGLPISVAFNRVAHGARKVQHNLYHPVDDTMHVMDEGGDGQASAGHCHTHQH